MKQNKPRRAVIWFAINFGCIGLTLAHVLHHQQWAYNLLLVITIIGVFFNTIGFLLYCGSEEFREIINANGPTVPFWLSTASDIFMVSVLAANGNIGLSLCWAWLLASESVTFPGRLNHNKKG